MGEHTTREKILAAMYDLVAEKGYDKASIGQLAEAIGMQKASIYYYFKSKEDLFLALVEGLYRDDFSHKATLFAPTISIGAYREELSAMGERFIDAYFEHQTLRKVYAEIDLQTTRIPALKEFVNANDAAFHQFLMQCMDHGVAVGAFPPTFDAELHVQILYTVLVGIDQAILYDLPVDPKPVWRAVVAQIFDGRAYPKLC